MASAGWMDLHSTTVQLQQGAGRRRTTRETPLHHHRRQRGLQFKDPGSAVQPRRRRRGRRRCGTSDSGGVEYNLVGEGGREREREEGKPSPRVESSRVPLELRNPGSAPWSTAERRRDGPEAIGVFSSRTERQHVRYDSGSLLPAGPSAWFLIMGLVPGSALNL